MDDAGSAGGAGPSATGQRFPFNRAVAFLGPYVSIVSGALAAWLVKHFPGAHLDQTGLASTITQGVVFAVGTLVTYALQHKWLDGWQKWEGDLMKVAAGELPQMAPVGSYDPATFVPVLQGVDVDGTVEEPGAADGLEVHEPIAVGSGAGNILGGQSQLTQGEIVLPTAEEEQASTPGTTGAYEKPESAMTPDEPAGEFGPPPY